MTYWLYWLWHRLTCRTCYEWAPFAQHHVEHGKGLGEATFLYLGLMLLLSLAAACIGTVLYP